MAKSPKFCLSDKVMSTVRDEILAKEIEAQSKGIAATVKDGVKRYIASDGFRAFLAGQIKSSLEVYFEEMDSDEVMRLAFSDREYEALMKNALRAALKNMSKI